jgi:hypothetical protein
VSYLGPLGNNWDFSYNEWLTFDDHDGDGDTDVKHVGLNFQSVYTRSGNAPLDFQTPDGQFTRLRRNDDGSYSIRYPRGEIHTFHGQEGMERDGRLMKIEDARGNFMSFHYEGRELHRVFDTFGRLYTLEWADGKIVKLIDFAGREVAYDYYKSGDSQGSAGDLKSVRTPVVVGTPGGNDFPDGKKTVYTYLTGAINSELLANLSPEVLSSMAIPVEAMRSRKGRTSSRMSSGSQSCAMRFLTRSGCERQSKSPVSAAIARCSK